MPLAITGFYAGCIALWFLILSARIITYRRKEGVSLGDNGDRMLQRRIRAQGNTAEYVPIALVLLAALELNGGPAWLIHVLGFTLMAGRLAYGYAMSFTEKNVQMRVNGTAATFSMIGVTAIALILSVLF